MVNDGPSLIESCDFCFHETQLNNIGLVLHNQARGIPCFIIVPMTTSYKKSMYSTSRSCLHSFYAIPIFPSKFQFTCNIITATVVDVYMDWPGCSSLNLYI